MYQREDFLKAIEENPLEITNQLVFSDWLQEQGNIFESQLRKSEIKILQPGALIWIQNNLFKSDGERVEGKISNIDFKTFENLPSKLQYESILAKNKDQFKLINLSILSLMWEDGTVKINGFIDV